MSPTAHLGGEAGRILTVEHAVEHGDVRTARLLERLGLLTPQVIGSAKVEDLEVQRKELESARAEARWFAELREITSLGGGPT